MRARDLLRMRFVSAAAVVCVVGAGCTVGPNYKKPVASVPPTFRGLTDEEAAKNLAASQGDQKWWEVYQDQELQELIRTAVKQNYDVRIAGTRILAAQAQLGITRADQYPDVSGGAGLVDQRQERTPLSPTFEAGFGSATVSAGWELDFWGKFRRATEAARANLVSTEWSQREVVSTLVANVASSYFQLRALDLSLEISKRTLASRQESLRLTQILANGGSTSMLDVRQAEQLVYTAAAEIPTLEQQIEQQENLISILLGENPGSIKRGLETDGASAFAGCAAGADVGVVGAKAGHSGGGAAIDCGERGDWSRTGGVFSADLAERDGGIRKRCVDAFVQRAGWALDLRSVGYAADFHGESNSFECETGGSAATDFVADLPADDPGRVSQRIGCAHCTAEVAGVSSAAGVTVCFGARCGAIVAHAIQRRRYRVSGSADERNECVCC